MGPLLYSYAADGSCDFIEPAENAKFPNRHISRADAARQKSEALRSLASQLIEEHDDYTKKNEQVLFFCEQNTFDVIRTITSIT